MDLKNHSGDDHLHELVVSNDPETGKPWTDGGVVKLQVRLQSSRVVRRAQKNARSELLLGRIDAFESDVRCRMAMLGGWSGIQSDGKPFEYSEENLRILAENIDALWEGEIIPFCRGVKRKPTTLDAD